jgi:hypothetical protein
MEKELCVLAESERVLKELCGTLKEERKKERTNKVRRPNEEERALLKGIFTFAAPKDTVIDR